MVVHGRMGRLKHLFFVVVVVILFYRIKFYLPYMVISRFFTVPPPTTSFRDPKVRLASTRELLVVGLIESWSNDTAATLPDTGFRDGRPRSIAQRYWLGKKGGSKCRICYYSTTDGQQNIRKKTTTDDWIWYRLYSPILHCTHSLDVSKIRARGYPWSRWIWWWWCIYSSELCCWRKKDPKMGETSSHHDFFVSFSFLKTFLSFRVDHKGPKKKKKKKQKKKQLVWRELFG